MYMCCNLIGGTNNLTNKRTIPNPCTKVASRNERKKFWWGLQGHNIHQIFKSRSQCFLSHPIKQWCVSIVMMTTLVQRVARNDGYASQ